MKILLFLSLLLFHTLHAVVILNDDIPKKEHFEIQYFYDEASHLTIDDIEQVDFKERIPSQFTKGYRYGNAWFKIDIKNSGQNEAFVLLFTEPIWSVLDLYVKQDASWNVHKNGLNVPLNERQIKDSLPSFKLHIPSGQTNTLYVKGQTIASQIGEFQIYTEEAYYDPSRISICEWYVIYAFVLFSFILLNVYNFVMTKEAIYGYYVLYVFVFIVFIAMHSGIYIDFGFPNWQEGLHTLGQLTLLALLLFSREFLELDRTYPLMGKVFYALAAGSLFFALLLSQNIPYSTVASNVFFCGVLITIIYAAVRVLKQGFAGAKYYLLALMLYLPSMTVMAMNFNTLLPNTDITRYSFLFGAYLEIFLFTLILTNRYKYIHELNAQLTFKTHELERVREQLQKESITDFLTGLYNRRYFVETSNRYFHTAKRHGKKLSVMMIDIDRFKSINDTYGHACGDHVLKAISELIRQRIRVSDIAARYGGEEFIVMLPETGAEQACTLAASLRKEIETFEMALDDKSVHHLTVSIGVSTFNIEADKSVEDIILRSDQALYRAKESGRNREVCH